MIPSLKAARAELSRRLDRIDSMHAQALAALPDDHTWRDLDELEIDRCDMALNAHNAFKAAEAEWLAYLASNPDD